MEKIISLDVTFRYGESEQTISPTILLNEDEVILIDCGYPGFLPKIEHSMLKCGLQPDILTKVLITHHDNDHMGALSELVEKYPQIQVMASAEEAPYISGEKKSLRLEQAEELQKTLPLEQQEWGRRFYDRLLAVKSVPVDIIITPGQWMPWNGGCEVVRTYGHTPGHISLYFPKMRAVVTGDAAVVEHGQLAVANPQFALNLADAQKSLDRLIALSARTYYCYHGGVVYMG
ncbi:MBL fold metallo-hydrolase [Hydrogenoanaerobacterium sp.]|uniref:MBL fold metallo-hydrolase n=1 Tax=Hydrogenoanaerobacterium sp. TaxID=2953763 RepID=UPI0028A2ACD7|nr:MBL fold metallo-hydrolase [Hydrogenoanaerobacterium sp.]